MSNSEPRIELDTATTLLQVNLMTLQEHPDLLEKTLELLNSRIDFGRFHISGQYPKEVIIGDTLCDIQLMIDVREPDEKAFEFSEQMHERVSVGEFMTLSMTLQKDDVFVDGRRIVENEYMAKVRREVFLIGEESDPDTEDFKYMQTIRVDYILLET